MRWRLARAKIYDLWIDPMYRDKGVEKTLIEAFIKETKDEGCLEAWAFEIGAVGKDLLKVLRKKASRSSIRTTIFIKNHVKAHGLITGPIMHSLLLSFD